MIDRNAEIKPASSGKPVPKWLTLDALESATVDEFYGYRTMWPLCQWGIHSEKHDQHQPEYGAHDACVLWLDYLFAVVNKSPDNHVTFKLNVSGRPLYVMLHDGMVFMGDTAYPDKFSG